MGAVLLSVAVLTGCSSAPADQTAASSSPTSTTPVPGPSACTTATVLATWAPELLAAQTLAIPVDMGDVDAARSQVEAGVGGIVLFGAAPDDLRDQLSELLAAAPEGIEPFVSTDEEGGSVQRMSALVGDLPSAREMAATMTPREIRALAARIGGEMADAGITMDLAPVLDLDDTAGPSASNAVGTRSFGLDPGPAARDGLAFAAGLTEAGITPVVKHFPGLGGSTGNTDDRPAATLPWSALRKSGLTPFTDAIAAGIPAIMVANATIPGLSEVPASVSPAVVTDLLREKLGYDGVVMTDSLSAQALAGTGYPVPRAAVAALAAGVDVVLYGGGGYNDPKVTTRTIRAITEALESGDLSRDRVEEAVGRVLDLKRVALCG